jgi:hypothetical protein
MRLVLLLLSFNIVACQGQNSVVTNEIITTSNNQMGVVSTSGKLLIDTIYSSVSLFYNSGRKSLPPGSKVSKEVVELYLVRNDSRQLAVFDKDGRQVLGFEDCFQIEVDEHTQTAVKIIKQEDNRLRSYLYGFDNQLIFEESFENVGYINHSDLIALIVDDGANSEYYLYNPFTKNKLGPYSHFNIYNKGSSPPLGMKEEEFEKFKTLNVITVRQDSGSDYIWAMIDMQGNEILPLEYSSISLFTEEKKKHPFFRLVENPDQVEFVLTSTIRNEKGLRTFFYDKHLTRYEIINDDPEDPRGSSRRIIRSEKE